MLVEHVGGQPGMVVTGRPARRPLPLLIVALTAAVVLQSAGLMVLGGTSAPTSLLLVLTGVAAAALLVAVARGVAATTVTVAEGGLVVQSWFDTAVYGWTDIEAVVVEPVSGRFTDPRASAEPDVGLAIVLRAPKGREPAPVVLLTQPAEQADALAELAARIRRSHRAAFGERVPAGFARRSG